MDSLCICKCLDTAHGETVCSIVVVRRIHVATVEVQVVTVILAVRRCTPIVAVAAHVAHATVVAVAITSRVDVTTR